MDRTSPLQYMGFVDVEYKHIIFDAWNDTGRRSALITKMW